jgi:hypothetical protein
LTRKKFILKCLYFFSPIIILIGALEIATYTIPSSDKNVSLYLSKESNSITTLILGASQNKRAINSVFIDEKSINMSHSRQSYWKDYRILQTMSAKLPALKRVVISSTARHFESPLGNETWPLNPLLIYYDINLFQRTTYFKDRLLFLSNPRFYKLQLERYYINKDRPQINEMGYTYDDYRSPFIELNRDSVKIENAFINNYPKLQKENILLNYPWFLEIVNFCTRNNIELIITSTPTLQVYTHNIDPIIIKRRDSILRQTALKYSNVKLFNQEGNDLYKIEDFYDYNHLNSKGAEKFSKLLNKFINDSVININTGH